MGMGIWPAKQSEATNKNSGSAALPPSQQIELKPTVVHAFEEYDVLNNPAVNPSPAIKKAYALWLKARFPQLQNLDAQSRLLTQSLRPAFPMAGESVARLAAAKLFQEGNGLTDEQRRDKLLQIQQQIASLQPDKRDKKAKHKKDKKKKWKEEKNHDDEGLKGLEEEPPEQSQDDGKEEKRIRKEEKKKREGGKEATQKGTQEGKEEAPNRRRQSW